MKMPKIVLLSALVSCALLSGCKDDKASQVTIEFMHSSVEQERQAVITKLIEKFEKENPTITVKQVPVEEDAYNTKVITLARTGALPEVIEVSHDYAKVMDKEQLLDRDAIGNAINAVGEDTFTTAFYALFAPKTARHGRGCRLARGCPASGITKTRSRQRESKNRTTGSNC